MLLTAIDSCSINRQKLYYWLCKQYLYLFSRISPDFPKNHKIFSFSLKQANFPQFWGKLPRPGSTAVNRGPYTEMSNKTNLAAKIKQIFVCCNLYLSIVYCQLQNKVGIQ